MRIKKAILLIALSFSTVAHAQINVMGTISDNEGQPLPGAVVVQYDATHTTVLANVVADIDGGYSIVAAPTDILEFSFLGYEKKQETVGRRAKINVALLPDNSLKLEESVVIGYGSVQRSDLTGSVSTVRMADIGQVPVTNADAALQGRVAGMEVMSTTGEPGATTSIRIRGTRSISASNEPLIVVDGVIDAVKDMNDINPADIKDITVLKDASSTAIYGSRGANGVILITTRSGEEAGGNKKVYINFKVSEGFSQLPKYLDLMDATEFALYRNEYSMNFNNGVKALYPTQNLSIDDPFKYGTGTDWQKEVTRTAVYQDYYLSASSSPAPGSNYRFSFAYNDSQGIIKGSGMNRYTAQLSMSQKLFGILKLDYKMDYSQRNEQPNKCNLGGTSASNGVFYLSPVIKPTDNYNPFYMYGISINTPTALIENNIYNIKKHNLKNTIVAEVAVIDNLKMRGQFTHYYYARQSYQYYPSTLPAKVEGEGGEAYRASEQVQKLTFEASATYDKTWEKKHHLDAVAVFSGHKSKGEIFSLRGKGYLVDSNLWNNMGGVQDKNTYTGSSSLVDISKMSVILRMNYNFKKRYYLTVNGRCDGSSNFAVGKKWGFFPSVALKWNISEEKWMKVYSDVDELSLRVSVGQTGNDAISAYNSQAAMASSTGGYLFNGQQPVSYYPSRIESNNLTWETTTMGNIAVKASLFNSRLNLELEGYASKTTDLLLSVKTAQVTGYSTRFANIGETSNVGVEFTVDTRNIVTKDFSWDTQFTLAHNKQMVLDTGTEDFVSTYNAPTSGYMMYGYVKGYPLNSLWGFKYAGTWKSQEELDRNEVTHAMVTGDPSVRPGYPRFYDINHDGLLNADDLCYLGNADPVLYGGFNNTFRYRNIRLSVYFTYSLGGKIYNFSEFYMSGGQITNQYRYMVNAWSAYRNPDSDLPFAGSFQVAMPSSFMVHDASYLRLQDLSLSYTLPLKGKIEKFFKNFIVGVNASNVYLWSNYNGYDPDVSSQSETSTLRRIDLGAYPKARKVVFFIQLKY